MNRYKTVLISILLVIISITVIGCEDISKTGENTDTQIFETTETGDKENVSASGTMQVHFIDVGQGDSILIESEGNYMLVDGGENNQEERLVAYLRNQGVTKLDYVIGTHPHSDHIGGIDKVIEAFEIGKVILPEKEHLTMTFEEVLDSIENKGLMITKPVVGDSYAIGNGEFIVIAPNDDYGDELNNWSVGIKLTFGESSFVMYGDGEIEAEYDMMDNGIDLSADVLKISHHGSSTSSSEGILKAVSPIYGVISAGANNSYGHPHEEVLAKLEAGNIEVHRTDEKGTIVAITDGKNIIWKFEKDHSQNMNIESEENTGSSIPGNTESDITDGTTESMEESSSQIIDNYIGNANTKKFHYPDCNSVSSMKETNKVDLTGTRSEVISKGYEPCGSCKP